MTCPTPHKTYFPDERSALLEADRIRVVRRGPTLVPYPCSCGGWHFTDPSRTNLTARIRSALKEKP